MLQKLSLCPYLQSAVVLSIQNLNPHLFLTDKLCIHLIKLNTWEMLLMIIYRSNLILSFLKTKLLDLYMCRSQNKTMLLSSIQYFDNSLLYQYSNLFTFDLGYALPVMGSRPQIIPSTGVTMITFETFLCVLLHMLLKNSWFSHYVTLRP